MEGYPYISISTTAVWEVISSFIIKPNLHLLDTSSKRVLMRIVPSCLIWVSLSERCSYRIALEISTSSIVLSIHPPRGYLIFACFLHRSKSSFYLLFNHTGIFYQLIGFNLCIYKCVEFFNSSYRS